MSYFSGAVAAAACSLAAVDVMSSSSSLSSSRFRLVAAEVGFSVGGLGFHPGYLGSSVPFSFEGSTMACFVIVSPASEAVLLRFLMLFDLFLWHVF